MILKSAILALLVQVQPAESDRHEPPASRAQRLEGISVGVARAVFRATCRERWQAPSCTPIADDPIAVAADDMAIIVEESNHLAKRVQAGQCAPKECDPKWVRVHGVMHLMHLARGLPQLHRQSGWSDAYWELMAGLSQESVDASLWEATQLFQADLAYCASLEGAFARYAKGKSCKWKGAAERAGRARWFEVQLRQLTRGES